MLVCQLTKVHQSTITFYKNVINIFTRFWDGPFNLQWESVFHRAKFVFRMKQKSDYFFFFRNFLFQFYRKCLMENCRARTSTFILYISSQFTHFYKIRPQTFFSEKKTQPRSPHKVEWSSPYLRIVNFKSFKGYNCIVVYIFFSSGGYQDY